MLGWSWRKVERAVVPVFWGPITSSWANETE